MVVLTFSLLIVERCMGETNNFSTPSGTVPYYTFIEVGFGNPLFNNTNDQKKVFQPLGTIKYRSYFISEFKSHPEYYPPSESDIAILKWQSKTIAGFHENNEERVIQSKPFAFLLKDIYENFNYFFLISPDNEVWGLSNYNDNAIGIVKLNKIDDWIGKNKFISPDNNVKQRIVDMLSSVLEYQYIVEIAIPDSDKYITKEQIDLTSAISLEDLRNYHYSHISNNNGNNNMCLENFFDNRVMIIPRIITEKNKKFLLSIGIPASSPSLFIYKVSPLNSNDIRGERIGIIPSIPDEVSKRDIFGDSSKSINTYDGETASENDDLNMCLLTGSHGTEFKIQKVPIKISMEKAFNIMKDGLKEEVFLFVNGATSSVFLKQAHNRQELLPYYRTRNNSLGPKDRPGEEYCQSPQCRLYIPLNQQLIESIGFSNLKDWGYSTESASFFFTRSLPRDNENNSVTYLKYIIQLNTIERNIRILKFVSNKMIQTHSSKYSVLDITGENMVYPDSVGNTIFIPIREIMGELTRDISNELYCNVEPRERAYSKCLCNYINRILHKNEEEKNPLPYLGFTTKDKDKTNYVYLENKMFRKNSSFKDGEYCEN